MRILIDLLQLDYQQASMALEVPVHAVRSRLAKARQLFTNQNHKPLQAV